MGPPAAWTVRIHLQPRATTDRIVGRYGDALKVQVQAAPVDGKANAALVDLLAETFGVPRRAVRILSGTTGRNKLVSVQTADIEGCARRLAIVLGSSR